MLTLFTNRREMERCFDEVQPQLKVDDLRVVVKMGCAGKRFALMIFWRTSIFAFAQKLLGGIRCSRALRRSKGSSFLSCPSRSRPDPLSCERAARDDQAWRRYGYPPPSLRRKQAAGRLIRKLMILACLFSPIVALLTKSYGKAFLNSLPSRTIKVMTAAEIVADLERSQQRVTQGDPAGNEWVRGKTEITRAAHIKKAYARHVERDIVQRASTAAKNALEGDDDGLKHRPGRISLFTLPGKRKALAPTPTKERGLPLSTGGFVSVDDSGPTSKLE